VAVENNILIAGRFVPFVVPKEKIMRKKIETKAFTGGENIVF